MPGVNVSKVDHLRRHGFNDVRPLYVGSEPRSHHTDEGNPMMTKAEIERIMAQRAEIVRDYQRGVKLDDIMERYGMPHKKMIYKCLGEEPRRAKFVPEEKRQAILNAERGSVRSLARLFGVSKTTIHRIRTSGHLDWEDEDEDAYAVHYIDHYWRCPDHGGVNLSPCPICAARGVIRKADNMAPASTGERKFQTILTAQ